MLRKWGEGCEGSGGRDAPARDDFNWRREPAREAEQEMLKVSDALCACASIALRHRCCRRAWRRFLSASATRLLTNTLPRPTCMQSRSCLLHHPASASPDDRCKLFGDSGNGVAEPPC
eukprot:2888870-Pleurochrysis_carterae.AAC.4